MSFFLLLFSSFSLWAKSYLSVEKKKGPPLSLSQVVHQSQLTEFFEPFHRFLSGSVLLKPEFFNTQIPLSEFPNVTAYFSGIYNPIRRELVFVPYQHTHSQWHKYDCIQGKLISYTHGQSINSNGAYIGAVYDPINGKIIFAPNWQGGSGQGTLHRYHGALGTIETYGGIGAATQVPYYGAVYDPNHNNIIFVPYDIGTNVTQWHYYDCDDEQIKVYNHNLVGGLNGNAYRGGAYDPINRQIIFTPSGQRDASVFHVYDCLNPSAPIKTISRNYGSLPTSLTYPFTNGSAIYDYKRRRIVFLPRAIHKFTVTSHFMIYDCENKSFASVAHGLSVEDLVDTSLENYIGGAYDIGTNRVILAPHYQNYGSVFHDYNMESGLFETYPNSLGGSMPHQMGAIYNPHRGGEVVFLPYGPATQWVRVVSNIFNSLPPELASHYLFTGY